MTAQTDQACAHCGGYIDPSAKSHDGQGHKGATWWCSDICAKIVAGTHMATAGGPMTKAELKAAQEAAKKVPPPPSIDDQIRLAVEQILKGKGLV